jgi:predicted MPP superfamily phosphohydrolase
VRKRIAIFVAIVQCILLAAHWFIYYTWWGFTDFDLAADSSGSGAAEWTMAVLSISFVSASLLAWRYNNLVLRIVYRLAAVWLGLVSFFFFSACAVWVICIAVRLTRWTINPIALAEACFGVGLLAGAWALVNAAWLRVKRVRVSLPNLPASWRGRVAALVSDTHLGHVRGLGFVRRIVARLKRLKPDIVFLAGDLYDGTAVNAAELAMPLGEIAAPQGTYFVTGNHEEFRDPSEYVEAMTRAGVRVLKSEKIIVDGLQIIGVYYHDSTWEPRLQEILQNAGIDRNCASILIAHEPRHLAMAEREGISLQVSGHTHGGQFVPWKWIASRIFGRFVHGLQRFGKMLVYTSYGAGTWGPPLRVGTYPEIVLIEFE